MKAQWTHLALYVRSLNDSIAFYEVYANLRVVDRHSDASSTGMDVAWLSDRTGNDELSFAMVLQEGTPHILPGGETADAAGPDQPSGFRRCLPRGGGRSSHSGEEELPAEIRPGILKSICRLFVHHQRSRWPYGGVFRRPGFGKARSLGTIRRTSGLPIGVKAGFVLCSHLLTFPEEVQQVGVDRGGLSRRHAVRKAFVNFQCAIPQQLC
jgi:catechol 2,3-dioxygenase-like lactoylglutathione lyase family enzyme